MACVFVIYFSDFNLQILSRKTSRAKKWGESIFHEIFEGS